MVYWPAVDLMSEPGSGLLLEPDSEQLSEPGSGSRLEPPLDALSDLLSA